jgi:hypothetical protein
LDAEPASVDHRFCVDRRFNRRKARVAVQVARAAYL